MDGHAGRFGVHFQDYVLDGREQQVALVGFADYVNVVAGRLDYLGYLSQTLAFVGIYFHVHKLEVVESAVRQRFEVAFGDGEPRASEGIGGVSVGTESRRMT